MTLDCVKLTITANLDRKYNCLEKRCGETSWKQLLLIMLFNYGAAMMKTHAYVNDISHSQRLRFTLPCLSLRKLDSLEAKQCGLWEMGGK